MKLCEYGHDKNAAASKGTAAKYRSDAADKNHDNNICSMFNYFRLQPWNRRKTPAASAFPV